MADSLASLQIQLELQSASFTAEMQKVNGQLNKLNKDVGGISAGFTKLGTVLKGAAVLGAFVAVAKGVSSMVDGISKSIDAMDSMSKAAQKVGVAVETLSSLKFAAEQSGVGFEALQTGLKKLNQNLSDFDTSTTDAAKSLRNMGIAIGDTTEQALGKIADRFASMPDGVQKTALAMNIFGKAGADLVPLLNAGASGIEELQKRAAELGIVFDDISAKQAELFNDKMAELKTVMTGIATQVSIGLLPALSLTAQAFADTAKSGKDWQDVGRVLGATILDVAIASVQAAQTIGEMTSQVAAFGRASIGMAQVLGYLPTGDKWASLKKAGSGIKELFQETERDVNSGLSLTLTALQKARSDLENGVVALTTVGTTAGAGGAGAGGAGGAGGKAGPLASWMEGIKKSGEEIDLLIPKMDILARAMNDLQANGQGGSGAFKAMAEEYKKLGEEAAKGNVGAMIEQQVAKIKEEAALTAEKMEYLGGAIAAAFSTGDVEGAQALLTIMDQLKGKTQEVGNDFQKLGDGIADAIASNANNAVNSFIDSIGTAKMSFSNFATSVLKDIAKMIIQMLVMKPLMDSIKGFIGGLGGPTRLAAHGDPFLGGTSLPQGIYHQPTFFKFANGGIPGARNGVLAEAGRSEAIVPLIRHGKDLGVKASPVVVNVYNESKDVTVETAATQQADGSTILDIKIARKVADMLGSGSLDKVFRQQYGLTRQPV